MRNSFAKILTKIANKNKKIVLLTGDIGNRLFDEYKENFPNRFYNCGVAENNMIGVAAGLSLNGYLPVIYTITPFLTSRSFEQIRLDLCYPKLNSIIVGTGAGLSYSRLGPTHHSLEDISLMQTIPNMQIYCPGDPNELLAVLPKIINVKGPKYLRIGKKGEPNINKAIPKLDLKYPNIINKGNDVLILSVGNVLSICSELYQKITKLDISAELVSLYNVKPMNKIYLKKIFKKFDKIILVEEHQSIGGVGNTILYHLHQMNISPQKLITFGVPNLFYNGLGEQKNARKKIGLDSKKIIQKLISNNDI